MNGWPKVTLLEACTKIQDGAHRSPQKLYPEPGPNRFPYLTSKNIRTGYLKLDTVQYCDADFHNEIYPRCNPELGDVLLTKDGANTGNVAINTLDEPYSLLSSVCLLKPDPSKLLSQFLTYYIQSKEGFEQMTGQMTGAAIKRIILKTIKASSIPLPPLPEQKRIVSILDEAFAGIDAAVANAEKNLANARELFESYLNTVFTQKGDGWVEQSISEVAQLVDSLHKTPKYIECGGFPMVRVTDVKGGKLNLESARRVDKDTFEEFSQRHASQIGDLVLSRVGTYGVPALVTTSEPFCLGQNTVFIVPTINSELLYYFLVSPVSKEQIDKLVAGTTQPTISLKSIKSIRVPIPPVDVQEQIVSAVNTFAAETERLKTIYQQKLEALAELKQSILQKAFAGELTALPEQQIEEASA